LSEDPADAETYSNGVRTATEFIASCRAAGFSPAIVQEGSGIGRVGSR
jgi:hypothetical protein